MLYLLGGVVVLILLIMLLKRVFHLRVEDKDYSDKDDYLERRIKKDEENK